MRTAEILEFEKPGDYVPFFRVMFAPQAFTAGEPPPMTPAAAWTVLIAGFLAPLVHVALSPKGGTWRPPPGARCPFGPRLGWLIVVLFLGPLGWLMFVASRRRRGAGH